VKPGLSNLVAIGCLLIMTLLLTSGAQSTSKDGTSFSASGQDAYAGH
jgi:hypothetical protein